MKQPDKREAEIGKIIQWDRELSNIQLGEYEPFIYYKQDTKETVSKILSLFMLPDMSDEEIEHIADNVGSEGDAHYSLEEVRAVIQAYKAKLRGE